MAKKVSKGQQKRKPKSRNITWEVNQTKIRDAIVTFTQKEHRPPNKSELAKAAGLNRTTIDKHFEDINLNEYLGREKAQFAALIPDVIMAIYGSAIAGKTASQELFVQLVGEWIKKTGTRLEDADGSSIGGALGEALNRMREHADSGRDAGTDPKTGSK